MRKFFAIIACCMYLIPSAYALANNNEKNVYKVNAKRSLLTELGGGDFAHAGDKEAINFVLDKLIAYEEIKDGNILDLGSGYGGTAEFLRKKGFNKIWGIDIDKNAVDYARVKYPAIKFFQTDALNLTKKFRKNFFSFVYMFNVSYIIQDKESLLKNIAKTSESGAMLAIFDYVKLANLEIESAKNIKQKPIPLKDLAGNIMYPIVLDEFNKTLIKTGWNVIESIDITSEYIEWYEKFLLQISDQRSKLLKTYHGKDIEEIENLFNKILFSLKNQRLGGRLIIAKKI